MKKRLFWTIFIIIILLVSCDQDAFRHLENAAKFFQYGMYNQAIIELKTSNRFLKDNPDFQHSMYKYLMWGIIGLKEGDQQKAIENFSKALDLDPKEIQIRFILSSLYLQQKDFVKALELFAEKKYLDVTYGGPDYVQGIRNYYAGKFGQAINNFEKMLETLNEEFIYFSDDPSQKIVIEQLRLTIYAMLGEAYLQIKKYPESINCFTKALALEKQNIILDAKLKIAMLTYQAARDPKNSGIYATLGYYYGLLNLNDRSVQYYRKAIELSPRSAAAFLGLATAYKNKLDYATAQNVLEQGLPFAQEPKMIAAFYLALGQIYLEYNRLADSVEIMNKAQELDPENLSVKNDLQLAKLRKSLANNPSDLKNNLALGNLYLDRKELQPALLCFNKAEQQSKNDLEVLQGKARTYYLLNKPDIALNIYKQALKLEPENLKTLYGLADVYLAQEKYALAIETLKKVAVKDTENVLLRHKLAYVYFYAGQNSEAVKEFNFVKEHINNSEMATVISKIIEVIS